jgi:hypothetical protein
MSIHILKWTNQLNERSRWWPEWFKELVVLLIISQPIALAIWILSRLLGWV